MLIKIWIIVGTILLGLFFIYLLFDMRKFNKRLEREKQEYEDKLNEKLQEYWETTKEKREETHTTKLFKKNSL